MQQNKMQIYTDLEQKTDDWHRLRLGKITGSCFHKLLGTKEAAEKYLYSKANEIIIRDRCDGEKYAKIPVHIERGCNWEFIARTAYVLANKIDVKKVGLIQLNDYIACSPDGLIDDDGLLEIKIPDSNNFIRLISKINKEGINAIPKENYQQIQFNLYISGRKWCDYVLYNPQHAQNVGNGLFVYRIELDPDLQIRIAGIVNTAPAIINEYVEQYYKIMGDKNE